jgi:hypothetical protein
MTALQGFEGGTCRPYLVKCHPITDELRHHFMSDLTILSKHDKKMNGPA